MARVWALPQGRTALSRESSPTAQRAPTEPCGQQPPPPHPAASSASGRAACSPGRSPARRPAEVTQRQGASGREQHDVTPRLNANRPPRRAAQRPAPPPPLGSPLPPQAARPFRPLTFCRACRCPHTQQLHFPLRLA